MYGSETGPIPNKNLIQWALPRKQPGNNIGRALPIFLVPRDAGSPDPHYVWLPQIVKFYPTVINRVINALFHPKLG